VLWTCFEPPATLYSSFTQPDYYRLLRKIPPPLPDTPVIKRDREVGKSFPIVIANSNFTAKMGEQIYGRKFEVGWVGIPVPEKSQSAGRTGRKKIIGSFSILSSRKNFATLIRAFARLLKEHPQLRDEVTLEIAGDGPERENLRSLVKEISMDENISLPGFLPREELIRFIDKSYLVAFLPLDEPLGHVPIEAGMLGKCVLASSRGGPSETVINGKTGMLVDPLSEKDIADGLWYLINHPEKVEEMGRAAKDFCLKNFTISAFTTRIENYYFKVLKK